MAFITSTNPGTDHQGGWYYIPFGTIVLVQKNKQMFCFGEILIDGDLYLDGILILEA